MSDAKPKSPKKKAQKKPMSHPKYSDMVAAALKSLKERGGSSRQAILKYIMAHYNVGKDSKVVNTHLKMALKRGVASGALKHAKGTGASGSFRIAEKGGDKPKTTKPRKTPVKKAAPKKPKAATPKKKAAKPKPKAAKKPTPKKKPAKPKKAKTPKKKATKKAKK